MGQRDAGKCRQQGGSGRWRDRRKRRSGGREREWMIRWDRGATEDVIEGRNDIKIEE